ncbi:MAG: AI-2E family transporter [Microthrixaceae bacterium]
MAEQSGPAAADQPEQLTPRWLRRSSAWAWQLGLLLLLLMAVYWLVTHFLVVTLPLMTVAVLATLTMPPRDFLVRKGMKPSLAATTVVIGSILFMVLGAAALAPSFANQLDDLGPKMEDGYESVLDWVEDGPIGYDRAQLQDFGSSLGDSLSSGDSGVVSGVVKGASTAFEFFAGLALLIVVLFFVTMDAEDLVQWAEDRLPSSFRPTAAALGSRAWTALSGYVRGTATIALIDALGIGLALLVLGVPLVIPLTLLVFLGGFLPVVGASVAGLVAVLVALADGGLVTALLVLAAVIAVQQLEGHILQPVIMRRAVALHPIVILVALATGSAMLGIVGAFLSVPAAAVLSAVGNELRLRSEAGLLHDDTRGDAPSTPLGGPRDEVFSLTVAQSESPDRPDTTEAHSEGTDPESGDPS